MKDIKFSKYIACICEGSAEAAIMDLLLDFDFLIFQRENLIEESPLMCRSGKIFEEKYLRKQFNGQISVVRVLDSRRENFKLSKAYQSKVDIINVITAPEIEMLIILNEEKYKQFKKSGRKPSDFCKIDLKMSNVKDYNFVRNYFADSKCLLNSIRRYKEITKVRKDELTLWHLLKNENK